MQLFAAGLNHHGAAVDVRERFAVAPEALPKRLAELLRSVTDVREAMLLCTCNRVEVYGVASDPGRAAADALACLGAADAAGGVRLPDQVTFVRLGEAAVRHIFRVTASLDSLVVGETQVTGQVKEAWATARELGAAGLVLDRCISSALRAAKRVRSETGIGRGAVSVSSVAVDLARSIFGDLASRGVLLVGAGEMAEQAAVALRSDGVGEVVVVNRSADRGRALAETMGGRYAPWDRMAAELARADVVIASTGARRPILDRSTVRRIMRRRRFEPLFLIDIAVPRDVDPAVGDLEQVYLYNIDDLQGIVHDNRRARMGELEAAERIVDEAVEAYVGWLRQRAIAPVIAALTEKLQAVAAAEAARVGRKFEGDEAARAAIEKVARQVVGKVLHGPIARLRRAATDPGPEGAALADAVSALFDLHVPEGTSESSDPARVGASTQWEPKPP